MPRDDPRTQFSEEPPLDLSDVHVVVVGCGSVGSFMAWGLASAGVGHLTLIDREDVARDNLVRHVCNSRDVGDDKARAVARAMHDRFAGLQTVAVSFCALARPERLRAAIQSAELIAVAVDEEAPKHLIDAMAWQLKRPVVYAGVYPGGWAAETMLIDPAAPTPCYACTARQLGRRGVDVAPAVAAEAYAMPTTACTRIVADLASISAAAALATRVATARLAWTRGNSGPLEELTHRRPPVTTAVAEESPNIVTAWRLPLRRIRAWKCEAWQLQSLGVPRREHCPLCGKGNQFSMSDFGQLLEQTACETT